jgi:hypothetical protein
MGSAERMGGRTGGPAALLCTDHTCWLRIPADWGLTYYYSLLVPGQSRIQLAYRP